jgi:hypothetical protein
MSIKLILSRRDKLASSCTDFLGHRLIEGTYHAFVDRLHANLPHPILRQVVHDSVKGLLKRELTEAELVAVAWRLAGNTGRLADMETVPEWNGQRGFEWVPSEVCDTRLIRHHGKLANLFSFQSLAGTIVPLRISQVWSFKKTSYLATYRNPAGYGFGFGRSRINGRGEQQGRGLYRNLGQFYGLRCFLLIDPKRSQAEPVAIEIAHTGATMAHNRTLIEGRDRSRTPCLKKLSGNLECFNCPYGVDRCEMATHEITYSRGTCPLCQKIGFFDSSELEHPELCLSCLQIERKT